MQNANLIGVAVDCGIVVMTAYAIKRQCRVIDCFRSELNAPSFLSVELTATFLPYVNRALLFCLLSFRCLKVFLSSPPYQPE